jgi:hypothetical protein
MLTHYTVKLTVKPWFNSDLQALYEYTLASSPDAAVANIRERHRHTYNYQIESVAATVR